VISGLSNRIESRWAELSTLALEELVLELDPVETQSVQGALKEVHTHQHTECSAHKDEEAQVHLNDGAIMEAPIQTVVEEDFSKLRVSQRKCPQT